MYFVLWFSISISKEKHIPKKKNQSKMFMKIFPRFLWGNDFATIKKFQPKLKTNITENTNLYYDFKSVFLKRNIFQEKVFHQKCLWKFFESYYFWGNDFATIKKFGPKLLIKIMDNWTLYDDFPSVFLKRNISHKKTIFVKFFMNIFPRLLYLRKWFCNNKKI